jgi:hypothetical protein
VYFVAEFYSQMFKETVTNSNISKVYVYNSNVYNKDYMWTMYNYALATTYLGIQNDLNQAHCSGTWKINNILKILFLQQINYLI